MVGPKTRRGTRGGGYRIDQSDQSDSHTTRHGLGEILLCGDDDGGESTYQRLCLLDFVDDEDDNR